MMKINVALLFGGKSTEHEVSLQSAKNIIHAIDKEKYELTLIGIDKRGQWFLCDQEDFLINEDSPKDIMLKHKGVAAAFQMSKESEQLICFAEKTFTKSIDVVFPILHGTYGEDGTVQGLLTLANIPFVGPSSLGSGIGMDKEVAKRLLRDAGIPVAKSLTYQHWEQPGIDFETVVEQLGLPVFVKPASLGSSVGISKVKQQDELFAAIKEAFAFDHKIIIEECIEGQEIECAILGNENPIASAVGAIIPRQEFYSYAAKYIDDQGAAVQIPADIPKEIAALVQELAIKAFQVLCCEGMARVDFFLTKEHNVLINEINTIPGFTKISMYPKLWGISGISYTDLIDRLIQLALERNIKDKRIRKSY
ncbi:MULTISPECIES: D-alanine--D-alanine ligase [Pelosinus]|uniref:D-alanine--D-alanine ligase n=1 Tax=Pelosinus fermentans B4 TaxID=1149862 RepID=I9B413_9FIRM|nr:MULTISPECIES: D-alanine--D-alanine ligase [Pelosinus]EIW19847.1 D-alanine/D-alanine ligase [Pelosinus fermentans B4]EIW21296.1 D-alanine--D-alanine ligase [Pelosinus fermentans A11]OAM95001.1 D-alanine--D-alanine ligase [Pelosinus fermentans DSM 17108]SDR21821.1 D-alanine--D-alanine ligase [Pelosinus fermentans]